MKHFIFLSVCVTALCLTLSNLYAQEILTRIEDLNGKVEVKTARSASWVPAQKGMTLKKDDQISTSFKSSAVLTIGGSKVTVRALTRLSIEEISRGGGQDQVKLAMPAGTVRAEVKAVEGGKIDFSVRSPSATASVRGTEFSFNIRKLTVISGSVALMDNDGKTIRVRAGHSSTISDTGKASFSAYESAANLYPSLPVGLGGGNKSPSPPTIITPAPPPAAPSAPPVVDLPSKNGSITADVHF
jgi:hypothetical protein